MSALCILAAGKTLTLAVAAFTLSWTHSVEKTTWQEDWALTPAGLRLRMSLDDAAGARPRLTPAMDPWRSWVFEIDGFGSFSDEQRQSELEWGGSLEARRITSVPVVDESVAAYGS